MKEKFEPSEKKIKAIDINRNEIFRKKSRAHTLRPQKESSNFGRVESRTGWR